MHRLVLSSFLSTVEKIWEHIANNLTIPQNANTLGLRG